MKKTKKESGKSPLILVVVPFYFIIIITHLLL